MTESHGTPENPEYPHTSHPADPTEFVGASASKTPQIDEIFTDTETSAAARYFDIQQNIVNPGIPDALPPQQEVPVNPANRPGDAGSPINQTSPGDPGLIVNPGAMPIPPQYITPGTSLTLKQKLGAYLQCSQKILNPWWHRFMVLAVVLYLIPVTFSYIPSADSHIPLVDYFTVLSQLIFLPWTLLAGLFFGRNILSSLGNVVADNQLGYFYVFAILIFSAIAAVIWVLIERKFTHPKIATVIKYIWKNGLRLCLATLLIYYGMIKFIPAQMHVPWPTELAKPIGSQDAQSYLWHFMGFSPTFESLVGFIELIGGILLLIPRFITLGGYFSLGVMLPTTAIVLCYDIPIKLISIVITLGTIILLWPSITALYGYLIRHKGVRPLVQQTIITFAKTGLRRTSIIIYIVLSAGVICLNVLNSAVIYDNAQLNPDLDINGRWIVTGQQVTDPQLLGVLPQQWTGLDITATNNDSYSHFNVEINMGSILGATQMSFPALYTSRYIQIGTKNTGLLPYDLAFNYVIKGDNLTLLALNADTNQPSFILTAKRADPWPHHPGEFHWILNSAQLNHDLIDP